MPAAKQQLEHVLEVRVDRMERFPKALTRFAVDFLNRLLGIANRIQQILLAVPSESLAVVRFFILFQRRRIHRAQAPQSSAAPLYT